MGVISCYQSGTETPKSFIFCNDKVRYRLVTAKMKLKEFSEFLHFFRSEIKIYYNGYNIGIFETNCIISGIIWNDWNGEWAGGTPKCAMQITILGNYWQYPLI